MQGALQPRGHPLLRLLSSAGEFDFAKTLLTQSAKQSAIGQLHRRQPVPGRRGECGMPAGS